MKFNTTQIALLEALKASLFDIEPKYPEGTNWDEVVKEAKAQTVIGVISPVIPVKDTIVASYRANYIRIMYEQDKLIKLLDNNNIPCVILKGSASSIYYPRPVLRAMGDIDVLVSHAHFDNAISLLDNNNYIYLHNKDKNGKLIKNERNIVYEKNNILIEMHHHFSSVGYDIDDILEQAIPQREYRDLDGYKIPMLPEVENGLVLLGHINQHMRSNDLGLRQIIDWEMYVHKVMNHDLWNNNFIPIAKKIGLDLLAINVTAMCIKYLGLPNKIKLTKQSKEDLSSFLEILFENGNFGSKAKASSENTTNRKTMQTIYNIKLYGFFRYFQSLGLSCWIPCQKYKFLKSFAWIYGILRTVKKGIRAKIHIGNVRNQVSKINDRHIVYKKIGVKTKKNNR